MRSVKLILVLLIAGLALIAVALLPNDMRAPDGSRTLGVWVAGLFGVLSLAAGGTLLRRGYVAARREQGGGPMPSSGKAALALAGVIALGGVAYAVATQRSTPQASSTKTQAPGAMSKAEAIEQEQREIRRRQGNDQPAPAPSAPTGFFK